jgi:methionine biosynthesis protein MetW
LRTDYQQILALVPNGHKVLDLGCGEGMLLRALLADKGCVAQGVEIDGAAVLACLAQGLPVYQGDLETSLGDYGPGQFNTVILNQALQVTQNPVAVLREMLRVGQRGIVGFPNFGHWEIRVKLLTSGRMPSSRSLPYHWYNTPNIHLFTILDFVELCQQEGIVIRRSCFQMAGRWTSQEPWPQAANWLAANAIFEISR